MEKKTHDKLYIPLLFFVMLIGLVVSCVFASILLNSKMEKMQETQTINATVSDKYISFQNDEKRYNLKLSIDNDQYQIEVSKEDYQTAKINKTIPCTVWTYNNNITSIHIKKD